MLDASGMTVDVKVILRNGFIGFALGVVVMLGISYGAQTLGSSPPAAPASAR